MNESIYRQDLKTAKFLNQTFKRMGDCHLSYSLRQITNCKVSMTILQLEVKKTNNFISKA